ncbi:MAG: hypothetical protein V3S14_12480 [Anaerolineae bacterium]
MRRKKWQLWTGLLLVGAGILLILLGWPSAKQALEVQPPTSSPTATPEPIIPTRTPTEQIATDTPIIVATSTEAATATPTITATPTEAATLPPTIVATSTEATTATPTVSVTTLAQAPTLTATEAPQVTSTQVPKDNGALWLERSRWGIGVTRGPISRYNVDPLRLGWYLDWRAQANPPRPGGVAYVQMIRLSGGVLRPDVETISAIAQTNPGSLWLVGNEPDVIWQDNVKPTTYARLYHDAYAAVKGADPTAQVAIGGVSQPTPLRLRYLDAVLASYQEQFGAAIPIDVWNVHNFILREERGSWGVDIPPGLPDNQGVLYEIDDGGNLDIFRQQIVDFRLWMAQRGYQDTPLIVSEYGILMPADYGFPPERVTAFMTSTFDFFLTAADPALGYPADDYRLVQLWCWYSLDDSADHYPTGNIFDPQTGAMTAVGQAWVVYVQ